MDPTLQPCPACGKDVHPVAGRCRHCKVDLVALRAETARAARLAQVRQQSAATPLKAPPEVTPAPIPMKPVRPRAPRRWPMIALAFLVLAGGMGVGYAAEHLLRETPIASSDQ